jgi:hypothetical protein
MIGSGIPISQSNAPFPNDMIVTILYRLEQQRARVPLVPLPASRAARDRKPPRTPLTDQPSERTGRAPLNLVDDSVALAMICHAASLSEGRLRAAFFV